MSTADADDQTSESNRAPGGVPAVDREPAGFASRNALAKEAGGNRVANLNAIRSLLVPGGALEERDGRIVRRRP